MYNGISSLELHKNINAVVLALFCKSQTEGEEDIRPLRIGTRTR
jgi:hypothetical protein